MNPGVLLLLFPEIGGVVVAPGWGDGIPSVFCAGADLSVEQATAIAVVKVSDGAFDTTSARSLVHVLRATALEISIVTLSAAGRLTVTTNDADLDVDNATSRTIVCGSGDEEPVTFAPGVIVEIKDAGITVSTSPRA